MAKLKFQPDCVIGLSPGYLRDDPFGREMNRRIHEDYKGRLDYEGGSGPFKSQGKGEELMHSSTFKLFAVDERAREYGARVMLLKEAQIFINRGIIKKGTYKDLGAVLDFSGNDHELAVWLYNRLDKEDRDLDRFPAVMTGLVTVLHDNPEYGLALQPGELYHYRMKTAKILAGKGGNFEDNDPNLLAEGVPSRLGKGQRMLYTETQEKQHIDNLGLSGFCLRGDLALYACHSDLAYSDSDGRVILVGLVGSESSKDYAALFAKHKEDYVSRLEQLRADIDREIAGSKR